METGTLVKFEQLPTGTAVGLDRAAIIEMLQRMACLPGGIEHVLACLRGVPALEQRCIELQERCSRLEKTCQAMELFQQEMICVANILWSQRTIDEYSDNSQVNLEVPVPGLGPPYVNTFPVPPGNIIRLTHKLRPGFTPTKIAIDFALAGGATNYLDLVINFYLVPGGVSSERGLEIGNQMRGNQFLNKDGTQIHLPFPEYRNRPLDIGSGETLAIEIKNAGGVNNLDSAFVTIYYDNRLFYALCKKRCGC